MDFHFTAQDLAWRAEIAAFLDREVTPEMVEEQEAGQGPGPALRGLYRKLGAKGWFTPSWPRQYGGVGATATQRLIECEELGLRRVYEPPVGANMAGPTIMHFGSDELKQEFLPRIAAAEIEFALGYTEPEAGSDLAALDIRAVEDGDDFVINGQKIFNTACHFADYHWLGARTDPNVPKHRGISLIIVPLNSPGITLSPLYALSGLRTNVVYYHNVRVPRRYVVGQLNRGFQTIASALDLERLFPIGDLMGDFAAVVAYAKETRRDGKPLANDPLVRQRIGELATKIEACRLLSYNITWMFDKGTVPTYQTSMLKLYVCETREDFGRLATEILGPLGQLRKGGKHTPIRGRISWNFLRGPVWTTVGGTAEVQRNIIATRGLGLPRA